MRTVVPDCCTLIYLAKSGLLDLLAQLFDKVVVTDIIFGECLEGKKEGKIDAFILEKAISQNKKFRVIKIDKKLLKRELEYFNGLGESSISSILQRNKDYIILTSDLAAYRKFTKKGSDNIIRSDELLLIGFERKLYDKKTFIENLVKLKAAGGTTEQRMGFFLSKIGGN